MSDRGIVKFLIWSYLLLWIFEGSLRKWVLPGLATPLLIVRDPIVIMIYLFAMRAGVFRFNRILMGFLLVISLSFVTAMTAGHGNVMVAMYGVRSFLLHLPMIWIMGAVLSEKDLRRMATACLAISIPITVLLVLQYQSSPGAWVNRGVGGEGTAVFSGAMGRNRPPGTWSFITGPTQHYALMTAFLIGLFLYRRAPIWLLALAGGAIAITIPVSISRALLMNCVLVGIAAIPGLLRLGLVSPARIIQIGVVFAVISVALLQVPVFQESFEVFQARWDSASQIEAGDEGLQGVLERRILGGTFGTLDELGEVPLFGYGLGIGTQVGSVMAFGVKGFTMGESEWLKTINELGPVLGLAFLLLKLLLAGILALQSFQEMRRGNIWPALLTAVAGPALLLAQWGQTTSLGFVVLSTGFAFASMGKFRSLRPPAPVAPMPRYEPLTAPAPPTH